MASTDHLDPKLKAAYDRVMNVATTTTQTQVKVPVHPPTIMEHEKPKNEKHDSVVHIGGAGAVKTVQKNKAKSGTVMKTLLITVGILIGLAVYTIVWIKVFSISVPLLSF